VIAPDNAVVLDLSDDEPESRAVVPEEVVDVFNDNDEPEPVADVEVGEPLLSSAETLAWLDRFAPDWREYRARPPAPYVAFGMRLWDVRDLRSWIGIQ
jgi:hypothetical protein